MAKKMKFERSGARKDRSLGPDLLSPQGPGSLPPEEIPETEIPPALTGSSGPSASASQASQSEIPGSMPILSSEALPADPTIPPNPSIAGGSSLPALSALVRKGTHFSVPPQGPEEPFSSFRLRALSHIRGLMQTLSLNPAESLALPTDPSVLGLLLAWLASGTPDDFQVEPSVLARPLPPAPIERLAPDATGQWALTPFDPASSAELPQGSIYFVVHPGRAKAPQGAPGAAGPSLSALRAQIITTIKAGDWSRAQATAKKASQMGLSDQEISSAIDEALPDEQAAAELPAHQLLASASAASPDRRKTLLPALQARFGPQALQGLPPQASQALQGHLAKISRS